MSSKSRKSTKRDKVRHSGKQSGISIRRNKIDGGHKASWKDVPDLKEYNEEETPLNLSSPQNIVSKQALKVSSKNLYTIEEQVVKVRTENTYTNKEMEEQTPHSPKSDQLANAYNQLRLAGRINMESQLLHLFPLLQWPDRISIRPHNARSKTGFELIAIACSNLTNQIWDGQITLMHSNSDMSDISFRRNIATYGGNTSVGWIGDLLLCGGDDGAVYAWELEEIIPTQSEAYDQAPPAFSLDSNSKDKVQSESEENEGGRQQKRSKSCCDRDQKEEKQFADDDLGEMEIQNDDVPFKNLITPYPKMVLSFYDHFDCVSAIATATARPGMLATGSWDHTAKLWDAERSAVPVRTYQHSKPVLDVKWNPHESYCHTMLTSARDGIFMWDIRSSSACVSAVHCEDSVYSLAWDIHNPHCFATGSETGCVKVMDLRMLASYNSPGSSPVLATCTESKGIINDIQYSPFYPGLIAIASNDTFVRILNLIDDEELTTIWSCQNNDYARGIQWSSTDPNRLMVTSWDRNNAIAVYDTFLFGRLH